MKKHIHAALLVAFVFLASCTAPQEQRYDRAEIVMGTPCMVSVFSDKNPDAALERVFARLAEIDVQMSANRADSELAQLHAMAGIAPFVLSDELFSLIQTALYFARCSDGAFNPAIGAVVKLWGIGFEHAHVPDDAAIKSALLLTDYNEVILDAKNKTVFLPHRGMELDLGAIAKGYAADEAVRILQEEKISRALINFGGNVYVLGKKSTEQDWNVGIKDPRVQQGEAVCSVFLSDSALVTSGSYERFFEQDGKRYHHIIDPKTGYPVDVDNTGIVSVSIIAADATTADALSTACFVLGMEKSAAVLQEFAHTQAIFIDSNNVVYTIPKASIPINIILEDFSIED